MVKKKHGDPEGTIFGSDEEYFAESKDYPVVKIMYYILINMPWKSKVVLVFKRLTVLHFIFFVFGGLTVSLLVFLIFRRLSIFSHVFLVFKRLTIFPHILFYVLFFIGFHFIPS